MCDNFSVWTLSYKISVLHGCVRSIIEPMRCFPRFSTKSSSISPKLSLSSLRHGKLNSSFCRVTKNKSSNVLIKDSPSTVLERGQVFEMETKGLKTNGTVENAVSETRRRSTSRSRSKTDLKALNNRSSTTTPAHINKNGYIPGKTPKKTIQVKEYSTSSNARSGQKDLLENHNASYLKGKTSSNLTLPTKHESSTKLSYTDDPIAASIINKAEQRQLKNQLLASSILSEAVANDNLRNKNIGKSNRTITDVTRDSKTEKEQNVIQSMMATFGIEPGTTGFNGCCNDTEVILNGSKKNKSESRMSIDSNAFSEDSSGHSSGSVGSSISVRNEKQLRAHSQYCEGRIKELEEDLSKKSESVQTLKDRVSDRELEITILQKRLSLRANSAQAANATANTSSHNVKPATQECDECKRKEKVIDQLYSKLEGLENAVESFVSGNALLAQTPKHVPSTSSAIATGKTVSPTSNLDLILKNINELNNLITESRKDVEYVAANTAQFQKHDLVSIAFYLDGFKVENNRFRPYDEPASHTFMKDLADGFYPAEMQSDYPEGVSFLVSDKRFKLYGETVTKSESIAFCGKGRQLESRPSSSASRPSIASLSPIKKSLFPPLGEQSSAEDNLQTSSNSKLSECQVNKKIIETKSSGRNKGQLEPIKSTPLKNVSSSSSFDKQLANNKGTMKTPFKQNLLKRITPTSNGGCASKGATQTISKKKDVCQLKIHGIEDSPFLLDLLSYDTVKTLRGVLANLIKTNRISKFMKQTYVKTSKDGKTGGASEKPITEPFFQLYFGLPKQRLSDDSKTLADLGLTPNGVLHMSRR